MCEMPKSYVKMFLFMLLNGYNEMTYSTLKGVSQNKKFKVTVGHYTWLSVMTT